MEWLGECSCSGRKKETSSVNWSHVQWWRQVEGETNQVLVLSSVDEKKQDVIKATEKEYNNLLKICF